MYTSLATFKELERNIISILPDEGSSEAASSTLVYAAERLHSCIISQSGFFARLTGNLKRISWLQRQELSACSESALLSFLRTWRNWDYAYVPGLDRLAYFWRCVDMQLLLMAEPFDSLYGESIIVPLSIENFCGDWGLDEEGVKLDSKKAVASFVAQLANSSLLPSLNKEFKYSASGISRTSVESWMNLKTAAPLKKIAAFSSACQYRPSLLVRKIPAQDHPQVFLSSDFHN
jgi:hypothetical protein